MNEIEHISHERAILVGAGERYAGRTAENDPLDELGMLADTAGATVVGVVVQNRSVSDPAFHIGKGKVDELKAEAKRLEATIVIFDNDLSPAQVSNLEEHLEVKVIDRSGLILDIFAIRAKSREAKVQVELAQLKYMLPRLTRRWTHLSRQSGNIGMRGPGETQLEIDRRRTRDRINHLEEVLEVIEKQRTVARQKRRDSFRVALVGYTNAGKSTLLNALSGADVPVEDKLFKTLDSVTRLVRYTDMPDMLLSDTVGFIRDLPHDLVASFKSTLSEVREADALVHVVDITNHEWEEQIRVVNDVLRDLGVADTPVITVFNKVDRLFHDSPHHADIARFDGAISISAVTGSGLEELKAALRNTCLAGRTTLVMDFGPDRWDILKEVYRYAIIHNTEEAGDALRLTFTIPNAVALKLKLTDFPPNTA